MKLKLHVEQLCREISLARVGQQRHNHLVFISCRLGHPDGSRHGSSGRYAHEQPFGLCCSSAHFHCLFVANGNDAVGY